MRAGRLNQRVTFQQESTVPDGGGGQTVSWLNVAGLVSIAAEFRPERGRERLEAGRLEAANAGTLRIRSFALSRSITEKHRVLIDTVPYQVRSIVDPDGRREMLELLVERGVAT